MQAIASVKLASLHLAGTGLSLVRWQAGPYLHPDFLDISLQSELQLILTEQPGTSEDAQGEWAGRLHDWRSTFGAGALRTACCHCLDCTACCLLQGLLWSDED